MYVTWAMSPAGKGRRGLQQWSRLARPPPLSALADAVGQGRVPGDSEKPQQQSAPSAQDAAARARLIEAVQRGERGATEAAAAAAGGVAAELQHLLSLQGLPAWYHCQAPSLKLCEGRSRHQTRVIQCCL